MTKQRALAEAQKRWGQDAYVQDRGPLDPAAAKMGRYYVGQVVKARKGLVLPWIRILGAGKTWEAAFAQADKGKRQSPPKSRTA